MAKRKEDEQREATRKQTAHRRRDEEKSRRIMIGLLAVGALLVLLIGAGIIQELLVKPGLPVATVNGTSIRTRDYQQQVKLNWFQQGQVTDPQGTSLQVLDQMVDEQLLRAQAQQRGISVTDAEIDEQIETLFGYMRNPPTPVPTATVDPSITPTAVPTDTLPTATPQPTPTPVTLEAYQEAYKNYLDRLGDATGVNEAGFRKSVEMDILQRKLYEDVTKDVPATGEQVHARHILIAIRTPEPTPAPTATPGPGTPAAVVPTPDPNASPTPTPQPPRDESQALARAIEVKNKLGAGEDFAALAQEYSDDTSSAVDGGLLPWFARDQGLVAEFEDAVFTLPVGQISDPVKTQFGYHIIKVEEKDPARELDDYSVQVKKYEFYQKWLEDLRTAAQIERKWSLDKVPPTPAPQQL